MKRRRFLSPTWRAQIGMARATWGKALFVVRWFDDFDAIGRFHGMARARRLSSTWRAQIGMARARRLVTLYPQTWVKARAPGDWQGLASGQQS